MKNLTAIASTAFQLLYVVALVDAIASIIEIFRDPYIISSGDPRMMAGAISAVLVGLGIGAILGLPGILLAWIVLRNKDERPSWFVSLSTFFAWAWILFIPAGTVFGILMLLWRRPKRVKDSAT